MNEDIPEDPRCKVCGGWVQWNNKLQICTINDACRQERRRLYREAELQGVPERPFAKCKRPGCPKKRYMLGYCQMHGQRFRRTGDPGPVGPLRKPMILHAGDVIGQWTVLQDWERTDKPRKDLRVMCRCSCGTERPVSVVNLTHGDSLSCGHGVVGGRRKLRRSTDNPYLPAGSVHGRLTLLADALRSTDYVLCHCECGAEVERIASCIKHGTTTSCGCARNKHGQSAHPLYGTWRGMVDRTTNPNSTSYESYGGRGIGLCERWKGMPQGFQNFIADMGERPDGMTLDRVDVDGNYEPGNVRWASRKTQTFNRRSIDALTRERDALQAELAAIKAAVRPAPRPQGTALVQAEALF